MSALEHSPPRAVLEATPTISWCEKSRAATGHRRGKHDRHNGEDAEQWSEGNQLLQEWVKHLVDHSTSLTCGVRSRVGSEKVAPAPLAAQPPCFEVGLLDVQSYPRVSRSVASPNRGAEVQGLEFGTRDTRATHGQFMIVVIAIAIFIGLACLDKQRRIKSGWPPLGHDVDDVTRQANNSYGPS